MGNNNSKHGTKKQAAVRNPLTAMRRPWKRSLTAEREGRGSWSWSCSWRGATRCEWRQSRVQMNAHLKLSPNPFTIDAVQSGRYLPHAAHVCVLASRTSNGKRQPIPLAAAVVVVVALFLFFFFWATAICLCLSGLRSTTTLTLGEVWGPQACFGFSPSFSPSPTMLTYRTTIIKPARQRCIQIELLS